MNEIEDLRRKKNREISGNTLEQKQKINLEIYL